MKLLSALLAVVFVSTAGLTVTAQRTITLEELRNMKKEAKTEPVKQPAPVEAPIPEASVVNLASIVSDGSFSKVEKPFVFVARDRQTYMLIGSMIDGFKADKNIDFDKHAVVAAFSGIKDTGGYAVSISMADGKCTIEDIAPAHGAIVTEALTKPFVVALVPVEEQDSLSIEAGETWTGEMEHFEITSGEFEFSGGFIGRTEKFDVAGRIGVLKHGRMISLMFDVHQKTENPTRHLKEMVSGQIDEKLPEIRRLEAGDLIDRPHPPLKVDVKFSGNQVVMEFVPGERSYVVNDGYEGKGKLTAVKN